MESGRAFEVVKLAEFRQRIDVAISEIVHWFENVWTPASGLPPFQLDAAGKPSGRMTLLSDLADYLPFLYLAGAKEYVAKQTRAAMQVFESKHVISTPYARRGFLRLLPRSNPFYSTDFLLGLLLLHQLDSRLVTSRVLDSIAHRILHTYLRDGWMSKEVVYPFRWRTPLSESDSLLFVEMMVDIHEITGNPEFLSSARELVRCWLNHPYTRTWGMVPQVVVLSPIWQDIGRFAEREVTARLYKHNTALIAGLLALHRIGENQQELQEAIFRVVDAIRELLIDDDGKVYFQWVANGFRHRAYEVNLGNANVIELLLDVYDSFGRIQDLETARLIAGFWMRIQNDRTGLVPESPASQVSGMDHQTDFAVNLHRLASVTGNDDYYQAAVRIAQGQMRYHPTQHGYVNMIHAGTGQIIDPRIETRYSSLFLKILLLLRSDDDAWSDLTIRRMMSDR